jgi:hypothetical protein
MLPRNVRDTMPHQGHPASIYRHDNWRWIGSSIMGLQFTVEDEVIELLERICVFIGAAFFRLVTNARRVHRGK